jgi:hypothetical protein
MNRMIWNVSVGATPIPYEEQSARRDAPADDPVIPVMDVLQLEKWFAKEVEWKT